MNGLGWHRGVAKKNGKVENLNLLCVCVCVCVL